MIASTFFCALLVGLIEHSRHTSLVFSPLLLADSCTRAHTHSLARTLSRTRTRVVVVVVVVGVVVGGCVGVVVVGGVGVGVVGVRAVVVFP